MKNVAAFLKMTVLQGLFILLPLLILFLILDESVDLILTLAGPVIELLPAEAFDEPGERIILALGIIIVLSFLIGLLIRSDKGRGFGCWLERSTLNRLPVYTILKKMTQGFAESSSNTFKPALFESVHGGQDLVYVVEEHTNDKVTILLPSAPTAFVGPLKIVDRSRVELLDISLAEFTKVLGYWGIGTAQLTVKKKKV